jgi:hypothetical protein
MNPLQTSQPTELPSIPKLLTTIAIALLIASGILVTTVLPAEYGIDPLGTGKLLGLTAISSPPAEAEAQASDGAALTPAQDGPVGHYTAEYKVDSTELVVGPYQYVEYKYRLEKGATMLYAWKASSTPIYDFHADPDGTPKPDPVSFDTQSKRQASGVFTAPFSGIHGWYWENPGSDTMTITLTTSGFYTAATEFRSGRVRRPHDLTPLESAFPQKASAPAPR